MLVRAEVSLGGFDALIKAAEGIDGPAQIRREAEAAAPAVEAQYQIGFEREEDPMGNGWAPPARDYGHPLMRDTRRLQEGAEVTATNDGVRIVVDVPYAEYHQDGTDRMPARKIVPEGVLSAEWADAIGEARVRAKPRLP